VEVCCSLLLLSVFVLFVSLVPNVTCVSGLFILTCPFGFL
jgi:hypothetical protein